MPGPPYDPDKLYHSIGEVAEMFDVSNSLIRYWENEFNILHPRRNRKGDRLFTQKDIKHIELIYHLVKERGYKLKGAKKKLRENKQNTIDHFEVVRSLKEIRHFLIELKEKIDDSDPASE